MEKFSASVRKLFNTKLASFLTTLQNIIWPMEDPLSKFWEKELAKFTENVKVLADWAKKEKLCGKTNPSWSNFCTPLKLFPD